MRFFTDQHPRTIDDKNRIQLPSQFRSTIDKERDGEGLYITLGERRGTLAIFTERGFEELASRIETEYMAEEEAQRFELQFYALASRVELDSQGRFVLPERLMTKARIGKDVILVGQKNRIELWNRAVFEDSIGIDWEGDDWPDWRGFLRTRPSTPRTAQGGAGSGGS